GYCGTPRVMELYREGEAPAEPFELSTLSSAGASRSPLRDLAHATAHLIHGSSEGRFRITYAPGHLSQAEIETVGYNYLDINTAIARYRPDQSQPGWNNTSDGER